MRRHLIDEAGFFFFLLFFLSSHLLKSFHTVSCFSTWKDIFTNGDIEKFFIYISCKYKPESSRELRLRPYTSQTIDCCAVNNEKKRDNPSQGDPSALFLVTITI